MLINRYYPAVLGQIFLWTSVTYFTLYMLAAAYFNYELLQGFQCSTSYFWSYLNSVEQYLCGKTTVTTEDHYIITVMLTYLYGLSFFYFWLSKYS